MGFKSKCEALIFSSSNDNLSISMSLYQKPVGFDEFKSGDTYLKNQKESTSSTSDKELIKQ